MKFLNDAIAKVKPVASKVANFVGPKLATAKDAIVQGATKVINMVKNLPVWAKIAAGVTAVAGSLGLGYLVYKRRNGSVTRNQKIEGADLEIEKEALGFFGANVQATKKDLVEAHDKAIEAAEKALEKALESKDLDENYQTKKADVAKLEAQKAEKEARIVSIKLDKDTPSDMSKEDKKAYDEANKELVKALEAEIKVLDEDIKNVGFKTEKSKDDAIDAVKNAKKDLLIAKNGEFALNKDLAKLGSELLNVDARARINAAINTGKLNKNLRKAGKKYSHIDVNVKPTDLLSKESIAKLKKVFKADSVFVARENREAIEVQQAKGIFHGFTAVISGKDENLVAITKSAGDIHTASKAEKAKMQKDFADKLKNMKPKP